MKRIEISALIGRDGRLSGPIAGLVREALKGHYAGRVVKIFIEGLPADISIGDRLFYRTQFLPVWLESLRDGGRAVDPVNERHIKKAHRFFCEEILGYETVKEKETGKSKRRLIDAYELSDRDFKGYLEDCLQLSADLQKFNLKEWKKSVQDWKQNEQPTMDLCPRQLAVFLDNKNRDNGGHRAEAQRDRPEQYGN